jgi:hypothetical protein
VHSGYPLADLRCSVVFQSSPLAELGAIVSVLSQ